MSPHIRLGLLAPTDKAWLDAACGNLPALLADHATCEKKAASTALSLLSRFPAETRLVETMLHLAQEELRHFERIFELMRKRGYSLCRDEPDGYVRALLDLGKARPLAHKGDGRSTVPPEEAGLLVDRLLALSLVEARSCERFVLLAERVADEELTTLYKDLALSEEGHSHLFVALAERYLPAEVVGDRLETFRAGEAAIVSRLPNEPRMHG